MSAQLYLGQHVQEGAGRMSEQEGGEVCCKGQGRAGQDTA